MLVETSIVVTVISYYDGKFRVLACRFAAGGKLRDYSLDIGF